ncbi:hypothetical protein LJR231_001973 [Phyllobacterium sp. LjRoot231]|uniref:hypothetical protein n=1 Tax=Phyllobacterium sp. LjRoot231 TaxID=3342289 RepID=UPI003ECEC9EE
MNFGFEGGDYFATSVEMRPRAGGAFSPVADLFKGDSLVIIVSDERWARGSDPRGCGPLSHSRVADRQKD